MDDAVAPRTLNGLHSPPRTCDPTELRKLPPHPPTGQRPSTGTGFGQGSWLSMPGQLDWRVLRGSCVTGTWLSPRELGFWPQPPLPGRLRATGPCCRGRRGRNHLHPPPGPEVLTQCPCGAPPCPELGQEGTGLDGSEGSGDFGGRGVSLGTRSWWFCVLPLTTKTLNSVPAVLTCDLGHPEAQPCPPQRLGFDQGFPTPHFLPLGYIRFSPFRPQSLGHLQD